MTLSPQDFERLGVYDPHHDSAEWLELLRYLSELGGNEEEIVEAAKTATMSTLAIELIIRRGRARSFGEAARAADIEPEVAARLWRALGYADPDSATIYDADAEALELVGGATELLGLDTTLGLSRVMGGTAFTLAEALADALRVSYEVPQLRGGTSYTDVVKSYAVMAETLLPVFLDAFAAVFRRHLLTIAAGAWSLDPEGSTARRDLLVGFVDMTGYSSLSRGVSSGRLAHLIGRFEELSGETAARHGGRVVKHIGDAAMVVFADVTAGCDFALEMIERFDADADLPPVHAGLAAGGLVAFHGDYFGDAVNVAARLLDMAPASHALVSAEVARDAPRRTFLEMPQLSLEHGDDQVPVLRLLRPHAPTPEDS